MNQDYISRKIKNCKDLISNATSKAQAEIYRGYLENWTRENGETPDLIETHKADEFEHEFPNKKAYYKRNGKYLKTCRFKEFLKSFE